MHTISIPELTNAILKSAATAADLCAFGQFSGGTRLATLILTTVPIDRPDWPHWHGYGAPNKKKTYSICSGFNCL